MTDLQTLRRALGGSVSNGQLLCPGPGHSRRDRSLAVRPSRNGVVVYSHAGDDWKACADYVRERLGLPQWQADMANYQTLQSEPNNDRERVERARTIWNEAKDPRNTMAEKYLASRKLHLPPELSDVVLRFHPACRWEDRFIPCLIAAFRSINNDNITAVHRIRLDQPERWPKTERKMSGVVAGAAIKLDQPENCLAIGEGIETCMAARQLGLRPVWALGSAGGVERFMPVKGVEELTILGEVDGGANRRAADACHQNWGQRRVLLILPPNDFKDFNDLIMERKNDAA